MPQINADDLADIFNASEMPTTAAVINGSTVYGIFSNIYTDVLDVSGSVPVLTCATSDISSVIRGTLIYLNNTPYIVQNIQNDNTGITRLILNESDSEYVEWYQNQAVHISGANYLEWV